MNGSSRRASERETVATDRPRRAAMSRRVTRMEGTVPQAFAGHNAAAGPPAGRQPAHARRVLACPLRYRRDTRAPAKPGLKQVASQDYLQTCKACNHEFRVPAKLLGKRVACPFCRR